MKVYLDACVLSRLTDESSSDRVALEAEACLELFRLIRTDRIKWSASSGLEFEVQNNPDEERRADAVELLEYASEWIDLEQGISDRSFDLRRRGYGDFDALHIAYAEEAGADVLLTTDDRLLRRAIRDEGEIKVEVANPVDWLKRSALWRPRSN